MIPQYSTKLFTEVWDNENEFIEDIKTSGLNKLKDSSLSVLFKLLYAKYGNSPIANNDENQFKAKIAAVIFQYGPTWEKRIEVQDRIRKLSEDELRAGAKVIRNSAMNPETEPTTAALEELTYVNMQNVDNYKKSILEGYSILEELLATDVTGEFINKFKICFKQFVMPEFTTLYISEE